MDTERIDMMDIDIGTYQLAYEVYGAYVEFASGEVLRYGDDGGTEG